MATRVEQARPDPVGRADRLLTAAEAPFLALERLLSRVLPEAVNPLAHTGALANAALIVATLSGVLVLFWYSASVHEAYDSVRAMEASPLGAGLVRSLHRYSSDAAVFFALVHGARLFFARRFTGPRSFAWITGLLAVATIWFVGWLGYWLVWDQRAQKVAGATARLLDPIPIFAEPFSRSFLVDGTVSSPLFFVVFFIHMLVPLVTVLFLWLHVTRLNRPRYLPGRALWAWSIGVLVALSALFPAEAAARAELLAAPTRFALDAWYLWPLYFADHLGAGGGWALAVIGSALLLAIPRALGSGRANVATVNADACNGCTLCHQDCPYDAIELKPRTDGRFPVLAVVNPDRCVGCGICAGSCAPGGIALPQQPILELRKRVDRLVASARAAGQPAHLAFLCGSSAGASFTIDEASGVCAELPGYRVIAVPCAGSVQPLTIERALKGGAAGVLIAGCGPVEPVYREGGNWTEARLAGTRLPVLRRDQERVRFLQLDRRKPSELVEVAAGFREVVGAGSADAGQRHAPAALSEKRLGVAGPRRPRPARALAGGLVAAAGLAGAVLLGSIAPWRAPLPPAELLFSFRHPGNAGERCRDRTPDELAALPVHMRQSRVCERGRAQVRVRISVDERPIFERAYRPRGLSSDGNSVAIERLPVPPGRHRVRVELGETSDPAEWSYRGEEELRFEDGETAAVLFERTSGFTWHQRAPAHTDSPGASAPRAGRR